MRRLKPLRSHRSAIVTCDCCRAIGRLIITLSISHARRLSTLAHLGADIVELVINPDADGSSGASSPTGRDGSEETMMMEEEEEEEDHDGGDEEGRGDVDDVDNGGLDEAGGEGDEEEEEDKMDECSA
jgi:hypothetical protein